MNQMSYPLDPDRSIAAWLVAEAPERAPERLVALTRQRIGSTAQHRPWWVVWWSRVHVPANRGLVGCAGLC